MNDLLELNGKLETSGFTGSVAISLPSGKTVKSQDIQKYINQLQNLYDFWKEEKIIDGALISVFYNRIIPKSRRIDKLFSKRSESSNEHVKGVRFDSTGNKHIITYYIELQNLKTIIERLKKIMDIMDELCNGQVSNDELKIFDENDHTLNSKYNLSKSAVKTYIKDLIDIEKFDVFRNSNVNIDETGYITLFDVDKKIEQVLDYLEISNTDYFLFDKNTIYTTNKSVLSKIKSSADYLISMSMLNLANYDCETFNKIDPLFDVSSLPKPTNEPTIGVIDTLYSKDV